MAVWSLALIAVRGAWLRVVVIHAQDLRTALHMRQPLDE